MAEDLYATLKTNRGDIVIQLFPNHAPTTVKNFIGLADGHRGWRVPRRAAPRPSRSTTA